MLQGKRARKSLSTDFFPSLTVFFAFGLASCHVSGDKPHGFFPAFISISITEPTIKRSFLGKCDSVHLRTILKRERENRCVVRVAMQDGPSIDSVFPFAIYPKNFLSSLWHGFLSCSLKCCFLFWRTIFSCLWSQQAVHPTEREERPREREK